MTRCLLEVIALTVADAQAARDGGADRVEVVTDMASDGLTPTPALIERMRAAVDIPLRVMLRDQAGFTIDRDRLAALVRTTRALRAAGAQEFVLGFLTPDGHPDLTAMTALLDAIDGAPWTFHRAIDHATNPANAWATVRDLPGLDGVLTAGSAAGMATGIPELATRATWQTPEVRLLAGGGLKPAHVPNLLSMGITAIHVGGLVRTDWTTPVHPDRVKALRDLVDVDGPVLAG